MNVHCVAVMAWPTVVRPDTRLTGGKLACSGSSPEMSPKPTRSPHRLQRCSAHGLACLSQATASSPKTCVGTSSRCPTWQQLKSGESKLAALLKACPSWGCECARSVWVHMVARSELSPLCKAESRVESTWHCRLQGYYIGLSTCSATSCAATALPSCLPPSGNRAASTWRLRSSSADVSEDAFLVAPPELVCLCSNSLKRAGEG